MSILPQAQTYGLDPSCHIWADQIQNLGLDGIRCTIHTPQGTLNPQIPLPGIHMVYNALAGVSVGLSLGMKPEEIQAGIQALRPLGGRSNLLHTERYTILDDCYNANPVSMCSMLDVLELATTRKVAILGDMGELGPEAEAMHASVGSHLAKLQIQLVITIGSLSQKIHETAPMTPQSRFVHFPDLDAFFAQGMELLKPGDSILVKASHSMGFEKIVKELS